jgi:SAM-dependent MidA family methyltransferase
VTDPRPPGDRIEVGLRRVSELDTGRPLPQSDPRLVEQIRAEIEAAGPMTFARFMEIALYDPEAGYYAARPADEPRGPGRVGDFLTAPEGHPIFGWTLARRLEEVWDDLGRPRRFVVREHGAGSGALAVGLLDGLRRSRSPLREVVRYQAFETSLAASAAFHAALEAADLAAFVDTPDDEPAPGAIIANELVDALPVHRVEGGTRGRLRERFVVLAADGALTTSLGPPSTPALAERLTAESVRLGPGQPAEICLALDGWLREAVAPLDRGLLLVIDYGYPAAELYEPTRGSTLRAYHRHRVYADPLVAIGRQDLTAHVDMTAVERAAAAAGLDAVRRTTQGEYLASLGLGRLLVALQDEPGATLESYLAARSAVVRMLDPRATGAFTVLEFGRGLPLGDPPAHGRRTR